MGKIPNEDDLEDDIDSDIGDVLNDLDIKDENKDIFDDSNEEVIDTTK